MGFQVVAGGCHGRRWGWRAESLCFLLSHDTPPWKHQNFNFDDYKTYDHSKLKNVAPIASYWSRNIDMYHWHLYLKTLNCIQVFITTTERSQ